MDPFNTRNIQTPNYNLRSGRTAVRTPGSNMPSKTAPPVTKAEDVIAKINESKGQNKYIVLFIHGCQPSKNAMTLLNGAQKQYERFDVQPFRSDLFALLNKHASEYQFNTSQTSVPVIFFSGIFIGGYDELKKFREPKI